VPETRSTTQASRISALEEGYRNIGREVGGLREDLQSLAAEIRRELNSRARVQWSPMIAAVAVVITVMGAFAQGPLSDIRRNDERISAMSANRFTDEDGRAIAHTIESDREVFIEELRVMNERIRGIENEDFNRPEAERMRGEIMIHFTDLNRKVDSLIKEYYCGAPRDVR